MNREPDEISLEKLQEAYNTIPKFKDYVEAVRNHGSRLKDIDEILMNKTVRYYYLSILPGECNETRGE